MNERFSPPPIYLSLEALDAVSGGAFTRPETPGGQYGPAVPSPYVPGYDRGGPDGVYVTNDSPAAEPMGLPAVDANGEPTRIPAGDEGGIYPADPLPADPNPDYPGGNPFFPDKRNDQDSTQYDYTAQNGTEGNEGYDNYAGYGGNDGYDNYAGYGGDNGYAGYDDWGAGYASNEGYGGDYGDWGSGWG